MKIKRKIIEIDEELCDGCGDCVTACEEGAIQVIDGKAKVINDVFCDGLGACIGDCHVDALKIVEREAEPFDEAAVKEHLTQIAHANLAPPMKAGCGCPSAAIQQFTDPVACEDANKPVSRPESPSALAQWPIQIALIPPTAPFLNNADILVAADCVPAACPDFHEGFLRNKILMLGCPKFDDGQAYVDKFAAIFRTANVNSVTIAIMEVPCCSGLPLMVKKGLELSGKNIPLEEVIISIREGKVLERLKN
ncbi:MAG: 4Fe-4S binding protein [Proteobacteria bacterium]|nr:4Fe-4S binding protein [Pseudomonadota bacterium]